jgi:hypothetical protein
VLFHLLECVRQYSLRSLTQTGRKFACA